MKLILTMKDPDCVGDMITDAVNAELAQVQGVTEDELESLRDGKMEKLQEKLSKWIEYGEYVRVEFDTDAGTATVLPA